MAQLYLDTTINYTTYCDSKFKGSAEQRQRALANSTTLYVGNLSFYTTEEQIYELFSKVGEVRRIVMGLDRNYKTPCGFGFVEYYTREDAADCIKYINGTKLDDRVIRTDWDTGFVEGRQYGRGRSGGQVRDEYRQDYDPGRGGFSKNKLPPQDAGPGPQGAHPYHQGMPPHAAPQTPGYGGYGMGGNQGYQPHNQNQHPSHGHGHGQYQGRRHYSDHGQHHNHHQSGHYENRKRYRSDGYGHSGDGGK